MTSPNDMRSREELLRAINEGVPPGIDWLRGAETYVAACFDKYSRPAIERYSLTKPLADLPPGDHRAALTECVHYQFNFVNCLQLLDLPRGATILDVACGGGWLSHYMARMGYEAHGFDISADFVALARRRLSEDPYLGLDEATLTGRFFVHNIERGPLPAALDGRFDAVILESCLHHFFDPVTALEGLARTLKPGGVVVLIEGENRKGPIKDEFMQVMREFDTLERPYPRPLLEEALVMAGLPHVEFVAGVNGWYSRNDPRSAHLSALHGAAWEGLNYGICAREAAALDRIFPWRAQVLTAQAEARATQEREKAAAPAAEAEPAAAPAQGGLRRFAARALRKLARMVEPGA